MGLQLSPVHKRCVALVASSWVPSEAGRRFESPQLAYFLYVMHFAWHCTRMHFVCRGGCSCARAFWPSAATFWRSFFVFFSHRAAARFGGLFFAPCTLLFNRCCICAVVHSFPSPLLLFPCSAMAIPFDLNVRLEEDHDNLPSDINEPTLEDHATHGNVLLLCLFVCFDIKATTCSFVSHFSFFLWTGFDLNMPLDEFGAVDLDFLQNLPGKVYKRLCFCFL